MRPLLTSGSPYQTSYVQGLGTFSIWSYLRSKCALCTGAQRVWSNTSSSHHIDVAGWESQSWLKSVENKHVNFIAFICEAAVIWWLISSGVRTHAQMLYFVLKHDPVAAFNQRQSSPSALWDPLSLRVTDLGTVRTSRCPKGGQHLWQQWGQRKGTSRNQPFYWWKNYEWVSASSAHLDAVLLLSSSCRPAQPLLCFMEIKHESGLPIKSSFNSWSVLGGFESSPHWKIQ